MVSMLFKFCGIRADECAENPDDRGPIKEYDDRVEAGRLRDDDHQRGQQISLVLPLPRLIRIRNYTESPTSP
jgi:hypothetical protein